MEEIKKLLKIKRNLIGLIVVLVLLVALPVGIYLAQTTQIFKPRAQIVGTTAILNASVSHGCATNICQHNLSITNIVPFFANANIDGQEINRIEIHWAELNSNGDPINWGELTSHDCGGESSCTVPTINDVFSQQDMGKKFLYIMDVWYNQYNENDEYTGSALWCTGWEDNPILSNGVDEWCGQSAYKIVEVLGAGGVTPVPTLPGGGGTQFNIVVTEKGCQFVSPVGQIMFFDINWSDIQGAQSYSLSATGPEPFSGSNARYPNSGVNNLNLKPGTYTFTVTAYNQLIGGSVIATSQGKTVTFDCDGGGPVLSPTLAPPPGSCTVSGPSFLNVGVPGSYSASSSCFAPNICDWFVEGINVPGFPGILQQSTTLSFTPIIAGSYIIRAKINNAFCGIGKNVTVSGGAAPTIPGGIYPAPVGGGTCNINPECGACVAVANGCGSGGGLKQCTFTGPAGCTQVTNNAPSQLCDVGNTCTGSDICEGGHCIAPLPTGGTNPTTVPTNAPTTTQTGVPTEYKLANVPSLPCPNTVPGNPTTFTPNEGINTLKIISWPLLSGIGRKTICAQFKVNDEWKNPIPLQVDFISASSPSPTSGGPTATTAPAPTLGPSATTIPGKTTTGYRIAESLTELSSKVYIEYKTHPTVNTYTFLNSNPGAKQICVQFKASDGTESKPPTCSEIELVSNPEITSCSISPVSGTGDITLEILGKNFGTDNNAKIVSNNTNVVFTSWTDTKVIAKFTNPPVGQSFPISLTTGNGLTAQGACSGISQLAIGGQLFCPQVKDVTIPDTEVTLVEATTSGKVIKEKATLKVLKANSVGVIEGLKTKLQEGKSYKLAIKVPRGVRRIFKNTSGSFIAKGTTTNIEFTKDGNGAKLPLGDIFPIGTGDGAINSADFTQLKRDIAAAKATTNSYSDLNLDNWVNSFEWACMRPEIGTSDENLTDD